jgi:hypothetical protein
VANYLANQNLQGVSVYEAMPKQADPVLAIPGLETTVIAFPTIGSQSEKRLGMGKKQINYSVTLQLVGFSTQAKGEDAQCDVDAIFETILEAIRADPALGTLETNYPILQAGEGEGPGSTDLRLEQDLPVLADDGSGGVHIWARLAITAVEIVTSAPTP